MSDFTPAEAERRLAVEFEREGWEYDLVLGRSIVEGAERQGSVDSASLARLVPAAFLDRYDATREDVAVVIAHALGEDARVGRGDESTSLVINNQTYNVSLGGAQLTHSNLNIGPGTQINVNASARKDEVLAAVVAIVAAGLAGDWNLEAARELAAAVDARDDITLQDIEHATREAAETEQLDKGRIRDLLERIAVSGVGGALATGIVAVLGGLL